MIMDMIELGIIKVLFDISENGIYLSKLLKKYQYVPISLADACLVRMSEIIPRSQILTFGQDFKIYRKNGRQVIPLITPV